MNSIRLSNDSMNSLFGFLEIFTYTELVKLCEGCEIDRRTISEYDSAFDELYDQLCKVRDKAIKIEKN